MKIRATFIGTNSLGYETGKEYELLIWGTYISRVEDGKGICPYGSVLAFLKNWDNIEKI